MNANFFKAIIATVLLLVSFAENAQATTVTDIFDVTANPGYSVNPIITPPSKIEAIFSLTFDLNSASNWGNSPATLISSNIPLSNQGLGYTFLYLPPLAPLSFNSDNPDSYLGISGNPIPSGIGQGAMDVTIQRLIQTSIDPTSATANGISVVYKDAVGDYFFDNNAVVKVTVVSPSPVPLPDSLPLVGSAILALALFGYSRRKHPFH